MIKIGHISNNEYEVLKQRGRIILRPAVIGQVSGKLELFYQKEHILAFEIRNFGQFPLRINGSKTLLPLEPWRGGMDDFDEFEKDTLTWKYINQATATPFPNAAYPNDMYAVEVEIIVPRICKCIVCAKNN